MTTGPRGFVVGRFVCIWSGMGAHNQPECVALIRRNGWTSRIQGMTFSLGTSLALLLLPALGAFWAVNGLADGSLYPMGALPILAFSLVALAGGAWLTLRSDADRNLVVKVLRREFEPHSQTPPLRIEMPRNGSVPVSMDVSGSRHTGPIVPADLLPVLDALEDGTETHVILSRSETEFMQCAPSIYGFTIEMRAAGDDWPKLASRAAGGQDATFQLEEVKQVLSAYVLGAERFDGIDWS